MQTHGKAISTDIARSMNASRTEEKTPHLFSKKVLALETFLPIADAFHEK
jgi:hypothetical protein